MQSPWACHLRYLYRKQRGLCCWCKGLTFCHRDTPDIQAYDPTARVFRIDDADPYSLIQGVVVFGEYFPMATVEHVIPRREGGHPTSLENLAMACVTCNNRRDKMTAHEFLAYLGIDPGVLVVVDVDADEVGAT